MEIGYGVNHPIFQQAALFYRKEKAAVILLGAAAGFTEAAFENRAVLHMDKFDCHDFTAFGTKAFFDVPVSGHKDVSPVSKVSVMEVYAAEKEKYTARQAKWYKYIQKFQC